MGSLPAVANAEPANPSEQSSVDSSDCGDVINLAVPGTWETNEAADRKTVPGMLAQITQPLEKALTNPSPLAERDPGSYRTPSAAATTTTASPSGSATKSQSPTTTTSASRSTKSAASPQNKVTARPVRVVSEQIPYVAQVGGPIAGVVTGNPMTLKQSKANGSAALEARATQLAKACPLAKFVILGYSQGSEIAGDFLSKVGNREGSIDPSRVLAGVLLSDPSRSPSTPDPEADAPVANPVKLSSVAETMIGPNVTGQGVLGTRDKGMGVLAERVTSFCAPNDSVCSLSGKSKAIAAIVPLLNLSPEDIPDYALNKGLELVRNVASADPADLQKAATSVITQLTRLTVAASVSPVTLPMELARVVFASTMLDDVAKVVNMPEFDALVSLTHPEELVQQATQVAAYLLLDAHRSYASYPVDAAGDTATQWAVKWVTSKVQAAA
nr:cutinase family protein [Rhodococcus opacus PD630]